MSTWYNTVYGTNTATTSNYIFQASAVPWQTNQAVYIRPAHDSAPKPEDEMAWLRRRVREITELVA